ncbi:hypothetical protein AYI70_g9070 [Smittium culicis]|uniref:Uncharacterized protein n=1 Tax=Smittium culicis TaxID=133412 RepID=A0A1R1XD06_9FUNG|nr:hypothetical protein AYI70_g9070 [Smittium culicis]
MKEFRCKKWEVLNETGHMNGAIADRRGNVQVQCSAKPKPAISTVLTYTDDFGFRFTAALDFARGWIKAPCSSCSLLATLFPFAILAARFSVSALMLSFVLGFRRCGARGFGGYIHESSTRCFPEDYTTQD